MAKFKAIYTAGTGFILPITITNKRMASNMAGWEIPELRVALMG